MRWLVVVLLAGCSAPAPGRREDAVSGAHTLYVDLTGASISSAAIDDARMSRSSLGAAIVPAFEPSSVAPDVSGADAITVLVARVQALLLPYDVTVTTTAPPSTTDFFAVYVGGTSTILTTQPGGIAGVGDVDCNDANPDSTGFAFSSSFQPDTGGVVSLAATIAHEAGHGLGLEHSTNPHDPMYSVPSPQQSIDDLFSLAFGSGSYSSFSLGAGAPVPEKCGHADPLDNVALLDAALGANPSSLGAPPTVELTFPPAHATLPTRVPIEVNASGAVRVEIYRDLRLVAVLDEPPYDETLELPESPETTLTVEVVGADGQRARASRSFAVRSDVAALCDVSNPCMTGTCIDDQCKLMFDGGSTPDASAAATKQSGCDVGGNTSPLGLWLVSACLIALRARSRRSSAVRG